MQNSVSDATEGRIVASVTRIDQASHMVNCDFPTHGNSNLLMLYFKIVQEQPELLAEAIRDILSTINAEHSFERPKL